jgi:hypothetical protein
MFTAETFGGPPRFSNKLGFAHLIEVHRHLGISEEQRRRFVELYMHARTESGLPHDEPFVRLWSASTSSSEAAWPSRTPARRATTSCTPFARSRGGRGMAMRPADARPARACAAARICMALPCPLIRSSRETRT